MENDTEALKLIWRDHIMVSNAVMFPFRHVSVSCRYRSHVK